MIKTALSGCVFLFFSFSLVAAQALEEGMLQIKYYRYRSLYQSRVDSTVAPELRAPISDLNQAIKSAIREKDYITADLFLEEALELVRDLPELVALTDTSAVGPPVTPSAFSWETAVLAGAEYSQYDTTGEVFPYAQVQTEFNIPVFSLPVTLSGYAKYYHEKSWVYSQYSGMGQAYRKWGFSLRNDFLAEKELDTTLSDYLEDNLEAELRFNITPYLTLGNRNTTTFRGFLPEDSTNFNYLINYNKSYLRYGHPEGLNFDASGEHEFRHSRLDPDNNYHEFTGAILVDKYFGWTNRVSVGSEHNFRSYIHPNDTSYYNNSYLETFLFMEGVHTFLTRFRARLALDREFRIYQLNSQYAPDTHRGRVVPGLACDLFGQLTLGCNLYYEEGYHEHPDTGNQTAQDYANGEDYRAYAVELTVDFFRSDKLFLNISDKYQIKEYHHPQKSLINQDSRTNSFVIFLTWTVFPWLELSVSTFDDLEHAEKRESVEATQTELRNYAAELVFKF